MVIIAFACDDDYEAPFSFSDMVWKVSESPNEGMFVIAQDDYISFVDLSQGALSHQWTIDEGCYYLSSNFSKSDTVYTDFILEGATNVSNEGRAHVLFADSGIKGVKLYNTYPDSVAFIYDEDTISAAQQGDIWVIDTTFMVDVYEHIQPAFQVYFGQTLVKEVSAAEYTRHI